MGGTKEEQEIICAEASGVGGWGQRKGKERPESRDHCLLVGFIIRGIET